MLPKVIGAIELLALVALAELMNVCQVFASCQPVGLRKIGKLFATIPTHVERGDRAGRVLRLNMAACVGRSCRARVEGGFKVAFERCARPGVTAKVQRILVPLRFVLIFEPVVAVLTNVLFFGLMLPTKFSIC